MKKNTDVLTFDNWSVLFKASFKAWPQIWWRIFTVNFLAVLMILLGTVITAGIGILLFGGISAVESIYINFISTLNLTLNQWGILAFLLFFWINWIIVFGITAKIASFLVIKDYVHKKSSNPFRLFFQTSWSFFWRYVGVGFRNFWYIFWPLLAIIFLSVLVFSTSLADNINPTVTVENEKVESTGTEIPAGSEIDLSSFTSGEESSSTEKKAVNSESVSTKIDSMPSKEKEKITEDDIYSFDERDADVPRFIQSILSNMSVFIAVFIVSFLLIILIIWRSVNVTFSQIHLIEHGKTTKEAFMTSLSLVKGNWWKVFFSTFGFFIVVSMLPSTAFGILAIGFEELGIPTAIPEILSYLYSWLVVAPVGFAFIYFLMLHLMKKKKIR